MAPAQTEPSGLPLTESTGWSIGGYGELILSSRQFHPDPKKRVDYRQTELDLARVSFFVDRSITRWLTFSSELELEHGGTGIAREIEWEEFGEYEVEVEKGGEVVLEQAFLEAQLGAGFSARLGHLLLPVGLTTTYHLPTLFSATHRPESESRLIPLVWHENGAEVAYRSRALAVRLLAVSGLDSTGFSSAGWLSGGSQRGFEAPLFNDVALALGVDYLGLPGTLVGLSGYTSGTTGNRPKRDLESLSGRVWLGDLHLRGQYGPWRLSALAMAGRLAHSRELTLANANLSNLLGAPRTPIASSAYALMAEGSIDLLELFELSSLMRLDLFARGETYDSMWRVAKGNIDDPMMHRQVLTLGVGYFPHPRVVLKGEWLTRRIDEAKSWGLTQHELNASVGFVL